MKLKITFLLFLVFPFFALATTYQGMPAIFQSFGDFVTDIWSFLDNDVPNFFERALAYIIEKITLMRIAAQIEAMKLAWSVSRAIMENFQIASKLTSAVNGLPQDLRAAISDMRIMDGLNLVIQSLVARYVLRFV